MTFPIRTGEAGCLLDIRLTPKAAQNRIDDIFVDGEGRARLRVKVTAVPEKGKANGVLVKILSKTIKYPQSSLDIVAGKLDRNKTLLIKGDPERVNSNLMEWLKAICSK